MKQNKPWFLLFWLGVFLVLIFFVNSSKERQSIVELEYSQFLQKVNEGTVATVTVAPDIIRGEFREADGKVKQFKSVPMPLSDSGLTEVLAAAVKAGKIDKFSGETGATKWYVSVLAGWLPMILLFLFFFWMMRGMAKGSNQAMSFGKSKAKLAGGNKKVTFKDVAGATEAKEELVEIIEFLKDPKKFQRLGGKIPKGVLLVGAPGTGKTLLAKAVAGEAGVPFFSSSGSEFVEMFVGVGASRVRDLFEQGRRSAPCLLFIDEIDAVGRHRGAGLGGGHDEREQTLNQLLVEMDGFDTKEGVILIAATNRPDVLDPALLRPGRFDRQVVVPRPEMKDREQILAVHAKKVALDKDVNLGVIAKRTPGFVGADLANVVNEGALLAARFNQQTVTMKNLEEAIDRVFAGPERRSMIRTEQEIKMTAYHEAGHALVAKFLPGTDPVHKVTIIPRGAALGYTMQLPEQDKNTISKNEALNRLAILFGGRAAEEIVYKDITSGAAQDISEATKLATRMVTVFGMSDKVGPIALDKGKEEVFLGRDFSRDSHLSEKMYELIDAEIKKMIDAAKKKAVTILTKKRDVLDTVVKYLLEKETLSGDDLDMIIKTGQLA